MRFLSYEEFPIDERPPRHIWLDGEKLDAHWNATEAKRRKKYGIKEDEDETWDDGTGRYNVNALDLVNRG